MIAMMQVEFGGAPGQVVKLHKPTYLIGRSSVCNLRISDQQLLLVHARLKVNGDHVHLAPQDRAEVTVNGEPIDHEVELSPGDRIGLGSTQLQVADVPSAPAANSSTSSKAAASREPVQTAGQSFRHTATEQEHPVRDQPEPASRDSRQPDSQPESESELERDHAHNMNESNHQAALDDQDHTLINVDGQQPQKDDASQIVVKDWALSGLSAALLGKRYAVTRSVTLGRARDCNIRIGEAHLSRRHARLTPTAQGLVVEDLKSANGTYVNGRRIAKAVLRNGDELSLDTVKFRVEERGVSSSTAETVMQTAGGDSAGARSPHADSAGAGSADRTASDEAPPRPAGPTAIEIQQACLQQLGDDERRSVAADRVSRGRVAFAVVLAILAVLAGAGWVAFELLGVPLPTL